MEMVSLVPKGGQWASPGTMSFLLAFSNYSWSQLNSLGSRHWDGDRTAENLCKKKKKKEEVGLHKQSCQARMQKLRTWCYLCQAVGSSRARSLWWRGSELGGSGQAFAIQPCSSLSFWKLCPWLWNCWLTTHLRLNSVQRRDLSQAVLLHPHVYSEFR